jgi:hypothetical protein
MLESAKDRILGVDTPGQHVTPRLWYGTTYLLIRNAIGCVSCLVEWGIGIILCVILCDILCDLAEPHGARGALYWGILSTASVALCWGIHSKA